MKHIFTIFLILFSHFAFSQNLKNHRDSIDVLNYDIFINLNFNQKSINGNTTIKLVPVYNNTKIIKLDLLKLNVSKIKINNKLTDQWTYNDSVITINLTKKLDKNDTVSITVFYGGKPVKDDYWGGFYFSNGIAYNMGVGMDAVPHSFGRVWFPCNDIFTDKALFKVTITVPHSYTATSGGKLIYHKTNKLNEFRYQMSKPIPTYLASVVAANFDTISYIYHGIKRDIPVEIYTPPYQKNDVKKSLINLPKVLKNYETLFGEYKWDVIRYSLVPFRNGAMEHAENITISSWAFDGTLNYETLPYHELSHSWFGNLVTCKTAADMWLNEGWATYCEALTVENLYGQNRFKDYVRKNHFKVIHFAHIQDNGYRAIAPMDIHYTYGTTVYNKGADVIHTLRYYIGDSLFFATTKKYLEHFKFKNASTQDFENFYSKETAINLKNFFDFWVYSKALPFFEITQWNVDNNYVTVTINQRIIEGTKFAKSNKLEVSFVDSAFNIEKHIFNFDGQQATRIFKTNFKPAMVCLDLDEHTSDLTIDEYRILKNTGLYEFDEEFFDAKIEQITDSVFLRVTKNCIEPDHKLNKNYLFQKNYYWTIEGIWKDDFKAKGKFYFNKVMDTNFIRKRKEIILLYRKKYGQKWKQIPFEKTDDYIESDLQKGQYCFAIKI